MNTTNILKELPILKEIGVTETDAITEVKEKLADAIERANLGYKSYVKDIQGLSHLRMSSEERAPAMGHLIEGRNARSELLDKLYAAQRRLEELEQ